VEKLVKISGGGQIVEFISNAKPGTILLIRRSLASSVVPKTCLVVFERYTKEIGHCMVSESTRDSSVIYLSDIIWIAEVPVSDLVYAMNQVLETSSPFN
jgi:hypothetical protein